jgi:hypothetical protein
LQLESEFYREVADAWSAAFAADRPHLLPYLDEFAANSGYFTFAGGDVGGNTVLPWRLMGLNSNLWYKSNSFTQGMEDPADQFRQDSSDDIVKLSCRYPIIAQLQVSDNSSAAGIR